MWRPPSEHGDSRAETIEYRARVKVGGGEGVWQVPVALKTCRETDRLIDRLAGTAPASGAAKRHRRDLQSQPFRSRRLMILLITFRDRPLAHPRGGTFDWPKSTLVACLSLTAEFVSLAVKERQKVVPVLQLRNDVHWLTVV